ncbi:hypothetical protein B0H19DRAFT_919359, partial [Mycena capillaripes]
ESEIYCGLLLRQKRGFPLYEPSPQINLPQAYREHGVAIGDVGCVTPEGIFDFFFNVFLPPEHPINANATPEDFSALSPYDAKDVLHLDFGPGSYISSPAVWKFPGGDFIFRFEGPQGAILALPDGAHLQKLRNMENLRAYAAKHADSWYRYINGSRGRGLTNGDLYLVTSCEKARSWGMSSYSAVREEFELKFKPTIRPDATYSPYRWSGISGRKNPAKGKSLDPDSTNGSINQTTFMHGWSISLPTGLWGRLFGAVETSSIVDFQSQLNAPDRSGFSTGSSVGSLFSFSWLRGSGATGGKRHAGQYGAVVYRSYLPPPW